MHKRKARQFAHQAAWLFLQNTVDGGQMDDWAEARTSTPEEARAITEAFNQLVQDHFNRSRT